MCYGDVRDLIAAISSIALKGRGGVGKFIYNRLKRERGNIFAMIFGGVVLIGVLAAQVSNLITGPLTTARHVVVQSSTETDMLNNVRQLSMNIGTIAEDIDNDGFIEFPQFRECTNAPVGGGCVPLGLGLLISDPWGTEYGYCVWDHGSANISEGRAKGAELSSGPVIAMISAGPNRTFETSCEDYNVEGIDPLDLSSVISPKYTGGGDDLVQTYTYDKAVSSSRIGSLPDEACTPDTVGQLRYEMGILQICAADGWAEISGGDSYVGSGLFEHIYDAALSTVYTSNSISFDNFSGAKPITATNGAILIINGISRGTSYDIVAGDQVQLRATSAAVPEATIEFYAEIGTLKRLWRITTRNKTPANLTITPSPRNNMNVTGPGLPAYGDVVPFLVRNTGESTAGPLSNAILSNTVNFEFYLSGSYVGDGCAGRYLLHNETCVIDVRPRASGDGGYSSTLTVTDTIRVTNTNLAGSADGWVCTTPWGTTIASGSSVTAYQTANVPFGGTCSSQSRHCNSGALSGTYSYQNCTVTPAANCNRPWGGTISHGSSLTAYQTANVPYGSSCASQTRTCNNGTLSGNYTHQNCTVAAAENCSAPWGGTIMHGISVTAYQHSSRPYGSSCVPQTRTCNNGTLSGSYIHQNCTVASPANCSLPWGGTLTHGQSRAAYAASSVGCGGNCASQTRTCNNGSLSGSYTHGSCSVQACGYWVMNSIFVSGLPACPAAASSGGRCSPITGNVPTGAAQETWTAQTSTCMISGGDAASGYFCNANPKVLCAYFNSIGLLADNIYAADVRYAQKFVSETVNRGYRIWAEPLTRYLEHNPNSILVPLLRPMVVGWAEEMAYRMGEIEESNWVGRVLINIGTPVSKAIVWSVDMYKKAINLFAPVENPPVLSSDI